MSESGLVERVLSWQAVGAPVRQGASQLEWQHPAVAEVRCYTATVAAVTASGVAAAGSGGATAS